MKLVLAWFALSIFVNNLVAQEPLTSSFSYQGNLNSNGSAVNTPVDFMFKLYDSESGGMVIAPAVTLSGTPVNEGVFSVDLNFGLVFTDQRRWLEIYVKDAGDPGSFTMLTPRQEIKATPFALFALTGNVGPSGAQGPVGPEGPVGQGVPVGGEAGDVLKKSSSSDFDTAWVAPGPLGGAAITDFKISLPQTFGGDDNFVTIESFSFETSGSSIVSLSTTIRPLGANFESSSGNPFIGYWSIFRIVIDGSVMYDQIIGGQVGFFSGTVSSLVGTGFHSVEIQARYIDDSDGFWSYVSGGGFERIGCQLLVADSP